MTDFSHLQKLDVNTDKTSPYTFYQIEGEPTLTVAPATEANKPYFNALLKRQRKNRAQMSAGNINAGMIAENRDEDRVLYPRFIVRGWKDQKDSKNKEVLFSEQACRDFLSALPDWLFDDFRQYCGAPGNFLDEDDDFDLEETVGN